MGQSFSAILRKCRGGLNSRMRKTAKNAAVLLSNRAETRLRLGDLNGAVVDAAASTFLDSKYQKAAFKLVKAYSQWLDTRSSKDTTSRLVAHGLASSVARRWRSFHRLSLFQKLNSNVHCDPLELWWEHPDFVEALYQLKSTLPDSKSYVGTWSDVKAKATENFKANKFALARDGYSAALQRLDDWQVIVEFLPKYFSQTVAKDDTNNPDPAVRACTNIAVILRPSLSEAWLTRAGMQLALYQFDRALRSLQAARELLDRTVPERALAGARHIEELERLINNMKEKGTTTPVVTPAPPVRKPSASSSASTPAQSAQTQTDDDTYTESSIERKMINIPLQEQFRFFGTKLEIMPTFHKEFFDKKDAVQARLRGVNEKKAREYLSKQYDYLRMLPVFDEIHYRRADRNPPTPKDIGLRLGFTHPKLIAWLASYPRLGSFRPEFPKFWKQVQVQQQYNPNRLDFNETMHPIATLHRGTTHVAVGFVDLGMLLVADLKDGPAGDSTPLNFVGYELNAHNVAKTLVIWHMLCSKSVDFSIVLQVWFSLSWTQVALMAFRTAVREVRESKQYAVAAKSVKIMLDHWAASDGVRLETVRQRLYSTRMSHLHFGYDYCCVGYLQRKEDRLAMAQYELTGEFCLGAQPATSGSIAFFDNPNTVRQSSLQNNVFSGLDFSDVAKECGASSVDVITAAENVYRRRVARLAAWATSGAVAVTLHCQIVEQGMAGSICKLAPRTMSWSNILDGTHYPNFHKLARACSLKHDTTHYGYTMEWVKRVFGTHLIDYEYSGDKEKTILTVQDCNVEMVKQYTHLGWKKYFRLPIPDKPKHTVAKIISKKYHQKWSIKFFSKANCKQFKHVPAPMLPISGGGFRSTTIMLTWKY